MNAKDALRFALVSNDQLLKQYLSDLSDADLLVRPAPGANHIAWQLGHVITGEAALFLPVFTGGRAADLPEGFADRHAADKANVDDPAAFDSKSTYLALRDEVRAATLAALEAIPDADLDRDPGLGWGEMAPTIGSVFLVVASHDLMHGAQFTVVRRLLGKPVVF